MTIVKQQPLEGAIYDTRFRIDQVEDAPGNPNTVILHCTSLDLSSLVQKLSFRATRTPWFEINRTLDLEVALTLGGVPLRSRTTVIPPEKQP